MARVPGGWRIPVAVLVAAGVGFGVWAVLAPTPPPGPPAATAAQGLYPEADHTLVDGEGRGLVQAYCTACHSLAPIVHHTGFTAEVWADEVTKMREKYGAPIDDATATTITTYLQQHYAVPTPPAAGTSTDPFGAPVGAGPGG
jgi:hypothetical protein